MKRKPQFESIGLDGPAVRDDSQSGLSGTDTWCFTQSNLRFRLFQQLFLTHSWENKIRPFSRWWADQDAALRRPDPSNGNV